MTRLESVSSELVQRLSQSAPAKQRAASLAASKFAASKTHLDHVAVKDALTTLQKDERLSAQQRASLDGLVAKLDDEYFQLQEAAEEGQASAGDYLRPFGQARAVAAILFADSDDPFEAATEAIYEASATTDAVDDLFGIVEAAIQ